MNVSKYLQLYQRGQNILLKAEKLAKQTNDKKIRRLCCRSMIEAERGLAILRKAKSEWKDK